MSAYVMGMVHRKGRPGVILLHEGWGLTPHIRDVVNRFAHEGYDALALDLLPGKLADTAAEAARRAHELDVPRALAEIDAAIEYLCEADGRTRVGLVGFGMGGDLALRTAHHQRAAAYVSFYGFPPVDEALGAIRAPGLLLCGEQDRGFPMARAVAFVQRQANAGIATEMAVYPHAGHGFFDDTHADDYQPVAARTGWSRTLALFNRQVKGLAAATS
jgi:carboxymethylenebutenolidase